MHVRGKKKKLDYDFGMKFLQDSKLVKWFNDEVSYH